MSIREKQLAQAAVTTSNVAIYTCPDATVATIKDFDLVNTSAGAILPRVYIVPSGGSVATSHALIYDIPGFVSGTNIQWTGTQVLEAGDAIYVKADAAGATITISGVEREL